MSSMAPLLLSAGEPRLVLIGCGCGGGRPGPVHRTVPRAAGLPLAGVSVLPYDSYRRSLSRR